MQDISRGQLRRLMSRGEVCLVEVLPEGRYSEGHLPGAINLPFEHKFDMRVEVAVPDKNTPMIVYCASVDCSLAPRAAEQLDQLGYNKVFDYRAGKQDWLEAGFPLEKS